MKKIYKKIWEMAEPYYKKGRPFDLLHVKILIRDALIVCKKEKIDDALLMPLVILHDIGYGITRPVYFQKSLKKLHMVAGAKLAGKILKAVHYPPEKTEKIIYWISVHDNWIFGENKVYKNDLILSAFTDLDFTWMATPQGFPLLAKMFFKGDKKKMLYLIQHDEKLTKRPFSTPTTKRLYTKYVRILKQKNG
ncbi:MAG: hypothetical protein WCT27_01375 [Patescibacteria group bacterium]|jgi:hypothetical protein